MQQLPDLFPVEGILDPQPVNPVTPDLPDLYPPGMEPLRPDARVKQARLLKPDTAVRDIQLSRDTGLDPELISRNRDDVLLKADVEKMNAGLVGAPGLRAYIHQSPHKMAAVADDVDTLAEIERVVQKGVGTVETAGKAVLRFGPTIGQFTYDTLGLLAGTLDSAARGVEDLTGLQAGGLFGSVRDFALSSSKEIQDYKDEYLNLPEELRGRLIDNPQYLLDPQWLIQNVGDAAASLAPVIMSATLSGSNLLGGLVGGLMEGASQYRDLIEEGVDPDSAALASQAMIPVVAVLNKMGLDAILSKRLASTWLQRAGKFFVAGTTEAATEYAEEPFGALFSSLARGDDYDTTVQNIWQSFGNIDVIPGAFLLGGGVNVMHTAREQAIAQRADQEQQVLDALTQNIMQTKLGQLDPMLLEEVVGTIKAGGQIENVYVPASAMASNFGQDLQGMGETLNQLGVSMEQFDAALATGNDLVIPVEKYASVVAANQEFAARFANDRRLTADGLTRNEAVRTQQDFQAETARLVQMLKEDRESINEYETQIKAIQDEVLAMRQQTGLVTDAMWADARTTAATFGALARTNKVTPQELWQTYGPQVQRGGQPLVDQQALQQDAAFAGVENQAEIEEARRLWAEMGTESPYFKRWFGESKVVDESGKPLVVYHGTEARMGADFAFETGRKTKRYTTFSEQDVESQGVFFSPSQEDAESYGGNVGEFYLSAKNPLMNPNEMPLTSKSSQSEKDAVNKVYEDLLYILEPEIQEQDANGNWYINSDNGISTTKVDENGDWIDKVFKDGILEWSYLDNPEVVRRLKERGYDSVRVYEPNDQSGMSWFVTDPTQIKSATGNRGTFDPADARIQYQSLSTRLPSAVKATEDPLNEVLTLDFNVALSDIKTLEKNMQALLATPNMRKPKGKGSKTPAKQAELFIEHVVSNLLFLHDAMDPDLRARAKLWYDGGRKTIETWAERYGISEMQGAALIAVLSPQNGWFPNVSQAERIADIVFGMRDFRWDDAMSATAEEILKKDTSPDTMAAAEGKTLEEVLHLPDVAARWIRVYDQTHNSRAYRVLTPEGGAADFAKTNSGADATNAWKSYGTIAKAVSILLDGRAENVYYQIGRKHKVRNFYNNLFDPASPLGFTTIDTHAVAAAMLRPLAAADIEVLQAFGGTGSASSAVTGMNGTYPLYLEAYKRAAEARGLLPREMQSITWEAVRGLFEASQKRGLKVAANAIWERYKAGEIEQEQAQKEIFELAGGVTPPSWSQVPFTDEVQRTYTGPAQERIDARGPAGKTDSDGFRVFFEVAPDPNDTELTALWNALPQDAKQAISQQVAQAIVQKVLTEIGASGAFDTQLGGYMGATNPSLALVLDRPELLTSAAKLLGYVLSQDSMMVVSDRQSVGTQPVGAVTIDLPDGFGAKEVEALYDKLWELEHEGEKLVGGHTTANGHMVILNFSNLDTKGLADVIYEHLGGEFNVDDTEVFSAFIDKEAYQYGRDTDQQQTAARRTSVQGRADNLRNEATRLLREALDARGTQTLFQLPGRPGGAGLSGLRAGSLQIDQRYGTATDGASSVLGVHYSREPRTSLSGKFYGTGIRGAEARRLYLSSDERIKSRIHFYVDTGEGIVPEPGVGANIHAVHLDNLYNTDEDPKGLLAGLLDKGLSGPELMNTLESAIIDAGFDGIFVPRAQATKGVAVLLGDHAAVPVDLVQGITQYQNELGIDRPGPGGIVKEKEVVYEKADRGEDSVSARGGEGVYSEERGVRPLPGARLVELRSTEKRSVPTTVVSPRHAAAAMSFLSDAPQEQLSALVLDKNGKPLAILSHSLGNIDSTQVDNRALLGAIQDVAGAKSFYLVHNHPAETAVLSSADRGLSENIRIINEGSGLSYGGIIAVTPSGYGDEFGNNQSYPPPGKQKKVPVVQRMFVKADRVQGLGPVSSPEDIKSNISTITGGAESGIILLSNNNVPIGFLPLDPAEMSRLRGDRLGEVLKSFHRTNATGIVGILPNEASLSAWRNVAAMANAINARPLDALFRNGAGSLDSARMQGKDVDSYGSKAFLQQRGEPQAAFTFKTKSGKPLIELFQTANQSSFLHETGHLYLEMIRDLAIKADAPQAMQDLWLQAKTALKIDDGPISREAHEEWARNLEAYFAKGEAPSLGMRGLFAKYAEWLKAIYREVESIFAASGTQFNADLKPVFDRLFATEQETREAEAFYAAQKPFFDLADQMTEEDRAALQRLRDKAQETSFDTRLRKLTEAYVKAQGGRKTLTDELRPEVEGRRVYTAIESARAGGFELAEIDDLVGEDTRKAISKKWKLVKIGGDLDPNVVAAQNGYDSAREMLMEMASAPSKQQALKEAVDERVEAERQKILRGLLDQDSVIAADEAYHNEDRLALLVAEFTILAEQSSRRQGARARALDAAAALEVAKQTLRSMPLRDAVKYQKFARAEREAAIRSREAKRAGKTADALQTKRTELLNHALFMESMKLRGQIQKLEKAIKKGAKQKSMMPAAKDLLQGLGVQYGLMPYAKLKKEQAWTAYTQSFAAKGEERPTLAEWASERENEFGVYFDPFVLQNAGYVPLQDLTVEQFDAVRQAVNTIRTVDRNERTVLVNGERIALEEAEDRLEQSILGRKLTSTQRSKRKSKLRKMISGTHAFHAKMEAMILDLDNWSHGHWWDMFFKPIADAENARSERLKDVHDKIQNIFKPVKKGLGKRVFIPEINDSLQKAEIMAIALNMGNEGNILRLRQGFKDWDLDALFQRMTQTEELLTAKDWKFVQDVWDYLDSFRPESFKLQKDLTGREPERIMPTPLTTMHGVLKGGYYPAAYDTDLNYTAFSREQKDLDKQLFGGRNYGAAMTKHSHLKERATTGAEQALSLDLGVITDHLYNTVHDLTHRKAVVEVAKLMRRPKVRKMVEDALSPEAYREFMPWLQDVAQERQEPMNQLHRAARWARKGTTIMQMGLKFTTMITQPLGILQTLDVIGPKWAAVGIKHVYGNSYRIHKVYEEITTKSTFMNNRIKSFDREVRDAMKGLTTMDSFNRQVQEFAFKGIGYMQLGVDMPTWWGAYQRGLSENLGDEAKAVAYADSAVRISQGSGATKDLARVQRGGEFQRLATMFYSYFSALYSLTYRRVSKTKSLSDIPTAAGSALALWFLPAILSELVAGRGPDDDEEWPEWMAGLIATYPFLMFVGVKDIASAIESGFDYQMTPAASAPGAMVKWARQVYKAVEEEDPERAVKPTIEAVGYALQLPLKQPVITLGNIWDYMTGEDPEFEVRDLFFVKPKSRR